MSDLNKLVFIHIKSALRLPGKDCQENMSQILSLNSLSRPQTATLQKILQNYSDNNALEDTVDGQNLPFGNSFKLFIVNYLILVRDFSPWSVLQSIDAMLNYYRYLTRCFENKDLTNILQKTMVDSTEYLIQLVTRVDVKLSLVNQNYKKFTRLEYFTELLLTMFNRVIISKSSINENVISYLAINIMKMYFVLEKPRLCNNILTNIRNLGLQFDHISSANKIRYKFLVGKFYFYQENFMKAFAQLQECLHCIKISVTPVKNIVIILKYLIPTALIVGRVPNFSNLLQLINTAAQNSSMKSDPTELVQFYHSLAMFMKRGDLNSVNALLYTNEHSLKQSKTLIALIQRTRVITLRNLVQKVYLQSGNFAKNTLSFEAIRVGLHTSIGHESFPKAYRLLLDDQQQITDAMVETILINLIDQQLIKANIFSRLKLLRFSKTNNFPDVYEVYSTKFQ